MQHIKRNLETRMENIWYNIFVAMLFDIHGKKPDNN